MVFEKIREIIAEQIGINESDITMETSFEDLGVDSLDLFQVIMAIEEVYELEVEEAEKIKTVADAVKYVEEKIEQ